MTKYCCRQRMNGKKRHTRTLSLRVLILFRSGVCPILRALRETSILNRIHRSRRSDMRAIALWKSNEIPAGLSGPNKQLHCHPLFLVLSFIVQFYAPISRTCEHVYICPLVHPQKSSRWTPKFHFFSRSGPESNEMLQSVL